VRRDKKQLQNIFIGRRWSPRDIFAGFNDIFFVRILQFWHKYFSGKVFGDFWICMFYCIKFIFEGPYPYIKGEL
jgi:hypothetical protein